MNTLLLKQNFTTVHVEIKSIIYASVWNCSLYKGVAFERQKPTDPYETIFIIPFGIFYIHLETCKDRSHYQKRLSALLGLSPITGVSGSILERRWNKGRRVKLYLKYETNIIKKAMVNFG